MANSKSLQITTSKTLVVAFLLWVFILPLAVSLQTTVRKARVANARQLGTNELAKTTIDGPQMSNPWIEGSNRIFNVVGVRAKELEIINSGYTRVLSKISDDGSVVLKKLDNMGNEIGDFTF